MWLEETVAPMVDTAYPVTIEDKYFQAKRGYEMLDSGKISLLMKTYTEAWEQLVYEKLVRLQIELGEDSGVQESMLDCLRYLETRCMLTLIIGDDKTGKNLRDFSAKLIRYVK